MIRLKVTALALCSLSLLVAACGGEPANTGAVNTHANRATVNTSTRPANTSVSNSNVPAANTSTTPNQNSMRNGDTHAEIPEFPWPPPKSSGRTTLARELFVKQQGPTLLSDVSNNLRDAFRKCGYGEISWYSTPNGFALVSQLEQFKADGTPLDGEDRWAISVRAQKIFTVSDYLRALFTAPRGRYRVLAFVVTDQPFVQRAKELTDEEARDLVRGGGSGLPQSIGEREFTPGHECHVLVYEYERHSNKKPPIFLRPGRLDAQAHLTAAKLINYLEARP